MKIYGANGSSSSRRVIITAQMLGLPLELEPIDLMKDRARLVPLNANSKIPVLVDGDFVLWESHAIMTYLCAKTPGQTLLPIELRARADVDRWLYWVSSHFAPAVSGISFEKMWKKLITGQDPDPAQIARQEVFLHQFAKVLDDHLATRTAIAGDRVGLPDVSVAVTLMYAEKTELPIGAYRNLAALRERVHALPAWKATQPAW